MTLLARCPPSLSLVFNETLWNGHHGIRAASNCYTYALDRPDMGWANPGKLALPGEDNFPEMLSSIFQIRRALKADGLIETPEKEALSGNFHAIACKMTRSGEDIHFFRRDADGTWSHKAPRRMIHRHDFDNRPITNPRTAHTFPYDKFGGYFAIPGEGIPYMPRFNFSFDK